jgi:hypothetical protein
MVKRRVWDDEGVSGAFPYEHYRLIIDGKMNHIIYPSIEVAQRDLVDAFHVGGVAYILKCVEAYQYSEVIGDNGEKIGNFLAKKPQEVWK